MVVIQAVEEFPQMLAEQFEYHKYPTTLPTVLLRVFVTFAQAGLVVNGVHVSFFHEPVLFVEKM
jgi:hypothetical protein